jgi:hypothetical protein
MNTIYGEDFLRLETQSISIYFLQFSLSIKAVTSTIYLYHMFGKMEILVKHPPQTSAGMITYWE